LIMMKLSTRGQENCASLTLVNINNLAVTTGKVDDVRKGRRRRKERSTTYEKDHDDEGKDYDEGKNQGT
ncbi:hypothetical protein Hamer_G008114, partial [Homarus americanus]